MTDATLCPPALRPSPRHDVCCDGVIEPGVLPVFYYNDMLISRVGQHIQLNLFEPRYKEMCRRLAAMNPTNDRAAPYSHSTNPNPNPNHRSCLVALLPPPSERPPTYKEPALLFMPNFDNYCCRSGDVGFVIGLTEINASGEGHSECFGVCGVARQLVSVTMTWVEPHSEGLHYAHCHPMDTACVSPASARTVVSCLQRSYGWTKLDAESYRERWGPPSAPAGFPTTSSLILGCNFPERIFIAFRPGSGAEEAATVLHQLHSVLDQHDLQRDQVHHHSPFKPAVSLERLCVQLELLWRNDGPPSLRKMFQTPKCAKFRLPEGALCGARLLQLGGMVADFDSATLKIHHYSTMVEVRNGTNVYLVAPKDSVYVTVESAEGSYARASLLLNRVRLLVVQSGRDSAFASLPDNVLEIVYDFLCSRGPASHLEQLRLFS